MGSGLLILDGRDSILKPPTLATLVTGPELGHSLKSSIIVHVWGTWYHLAHTHFRQIIMELLPAVQANDVGHTGF